MRKVYSVGDLVLQFRLMFINVGCMSCISDLIRLVEPTFRFKGILVHVLNFVRLKKEKVITMM